MQPKGWSTPCPLPKGVRATARFGSTRGRTVVVFITDNVTGSKIHLPLMRLYIQRERRAARRDADATRRDVADRDETA